MATQTQAETMFAAKEALVDLLSSSADPALVDVQVSWSHPGKALRKEVVIVGNIKPNEQKAVELSARQRECRFTIEVAVDTSRRGEAKIVAERTSEIAAAVERIVAGATELGLPETVLYAQVTSADLTEGFDGDGREALTELLVSVRARLPRS